MVTIVSMLLLEAGSGWKQGGIRDIADWQQEPDEENRGV